MGIIGNAETHGVLCEVLAERIKQDAKWGEQDHHVAEWITILGEEYGEACRAAYHGWHDGVDMANYRAELIHVAAVAVVAIECYDRQVEFDRRVMMRKGA